MLVVIKVRLRSVFGICDKVLLLWCKSINTHGQDTQEQKNSLELHCCRIGLAAESMRVGVESERNCAKTKIKIGSLMMDAEQKGR